MVIYAALARRARRAPNETQQPRQSETGLLTIPSSTLPLKPATRQTALWIQDGTEIGHPRGSGGLLSTTSDYLCFAQLLLNGGELDGTRLLGSKTVELMTMNHLPSHLMPIWMGANPLRGLGYGLGFGVVVDHAQTGLLGSKGAFGWGGAAATRIWVDPKESLIGLIMLQYLGLEAPVRPSFRNLVYQAIVD